VQTERGISPVRWPSRKPVYALPRLLRLAITYFGQEEEALGEEDLTIVHHRSRTAPGP
jgi:hypothetical protein